MTGDWGPFAATVIAAAMGLLGTWLVYRNQRGANKTTDTQALIDQLQEERASDRVQFGETVQRLEDRQTRLERRLESAEVLFRIASDYVLKLRHHIDSGLPPPPPPFPPEMLRGQIGDR